MNHHHRKILHGLFAHPVSANIAMKDVEAVLRELGGELENKSGARIGVALNGHKAAFHEAKHSLPVEEVILIRKFLEEAGVDPERDYPL